MKKILLLFLMAFILSGFVFAQPETGMVLPMGVICEAVAQPAGVISDAIDSEPAVVISDNAIILTGLARADPVDGSLRVDSDYILHNSQRQIESITVFGFA